MKSVPRQQQILCMLTLVLWLAVYGSGLLLETVESRIVLAPHNMQKQLGEEGKPIFDAVQSDIENRSPAWAFVVAVLCYSPTNLAILALISAFLGGCVSNAIVSSLEEHERQVLAPRQVEFMSEHPLAATTRGFVVYLCVIAGLYLGMDDPFKNSSPGQYARLAGMLSLVAFIVGYDPSRILGWINLAPNPIQTETRTREVKVKETETHTTSSAPLPPVTVVLPAEKPHPAAPVPPVPEASPDTAASPNKPPVTVVGAAASPADAKRVSVPDDSGESGIGKTRRRTPK